MEAEKITTFRLDYITVKMRSDGTSSKWLNILKGYKDIKISFQKDLNKINYTIYFMRRYSLKMTRKIKMILKG